MKNKSKKTSSCPLFLSIIKINIKELLFITVLSILVIICKLLQIILLRLFIIIFKANDKIKQVEKSPLKIWDKINFYSAAFLLNKISLIFLQNHAN